MTSDEYADAVDRADHLRQVAKEAAPDDFACYSALLFDDDSLAIQLLHRGTLESCERTARLIDALSYNGSKRVVDSQVRWMPFAEYERGIREMT